MTPRTLIVMSFVAMTIVPRPSEACRWFGTTFECDFSGARAQFGTQVEGEPRSGPVQSFQGQAGLPGDRPVPNGRLSLRFQDVGSDPSLCRKIGNETYCY